MPGVQPRCCRMLRRYAFQSQNVICQTARLTLGLTSPTTNSPSLSLITGSCEYSCRFRARVGGWKMVHLRTGTTPTGLQPPCGDSGDPQSPLRHRCQLGRRCLFHHYRVEISPFRCLRFGVGRRESCKELLHKILISSITYIIPQLYKFDLWTP